jgi:hypothetical protein
MNSSGTKAPEREFFHVRRRRRRNAHWLNIRSMSRHLEIVGAQCSKPCKDSENYTIAADTHERKGVFAICAYTPQKPLAHHCPSPMQANLHVLLCKIERRGCFRSAELFDVSHHDDSPVLVRKTKYGFLQKLPEFGDERSLLRVRRGFDNAHRTFFVILGIVQLLAAVAQAEAPQSFMDCNAREPGREKCTSGKLVEMLICPNVGILHHVFRFRIIAQDGARNAIEPLVVAAKVVPIRY